MESFTCSPCIRDKIFFMRIALSRLSQKFWYCIRISEFYKTKFDILVPVPDILYTTFELDFSVSVNLFNKHCFSVPKTLLPCFVLYHVFFVILLLLAPWSVCLVSHPRPLNGRAPQGFLHITFFSFFCTNICWCQSFSRLSIPSMY